jgi:hypothetical protein
MDTGGNRWPLAGLPLQKRKWSEFRRLNRFDATSNKRKTGCFSNRW